MNPAKFQALLDMFNDFGPDVMCNTADWDDLTCQEQMLLEQMCEAY
jgi:hypothetical protein